MLGRAVAAVNNKNKAAKMGGEEAMTTGALVRFGGPRPPPPPARVQESIIGQQAVASPCFNFQLDLEVKLEQPVP